MATSKLSKKYLTSVPSEVRKKFGLGAGDELEWVPMGDEIIVKVRMRTKEDPLLKVIGMAEGEPTDVNRDHNKILYGR